MTDWEKVRAEYIRSNLSLTQIADKFDIPFKTIKAKSAGQKWSLQRAKYQEDLRESIDRKVVDADAQKKIDQLQRIADTADRLRNVTPYPTLSTTVSVTA